MENKENIIVIRQRTWYIYVVVLIVTICLDFAMNNQLFKDLTIYYSLFILCVIIFCYHSFSSRKITLTNELLIFEYYIWFKWRNKAFKINDIKTFYYHSFKGISIEIRLSSYSKSVNFLLTGFRENSIRELYSELYNHPLNKLENSLE